MQLKIRPWLIRVKERERGRKRRGTVDTACTIDGGWCTELAWRTANDERSLHSDQSLHSGLIPLVLSLSLIGLLSSECDWKSIEGKITMELVLQSQGFYFTVN